MLGQYSSILTGRRLIASSSSDNAVRLWNLAAEALQQTLRGHTSSVNAITFSPDSRLIASASSDKTVRLWDSATGVSLQTLEIHLDEVVGQLFFSSDGKYLHTNRRRLSICSLSPSVVPLSLKPEIETPKEKEIEMEEDISVNGSWVI